MNKKLHKHWSDLICPLFPADTEFVPFVDFDYFLTQAAWTLTTDKERPNKRAVVQIIIPRDVIEDYEDKAPSKRQEDDKKLIAYIGSILDNYDFDHNTQKYSPSPEVKVTIGGEVLNS